MNNDSMKLFNESDKDLLKSLKPVLRDHICRSSVGDGIPASNVIIAGGWFASTFEQRPAKDIDFFILCGQPAESRFLQYRETIIENAQKAGIALEASSGTSYLKNNMIWEVLTDKTTTPHRQYILSKHWERITVIDEFDFLHTMISYCFNNTPDGVLYTTYKAFDSAKRKILVANKKRAEPIFQWRIDKFRERGFDVSAFKNIRFYHNHKSGVGMPWQRLPTRQSYATNFKPQDDSFNVDWEKIFTETPLDSIRPKGEPLQPYQRSFICEEGTSYNPRSATAQAFHDVWKNGLISTKRFYKKVIGDTCE